MTESVPIRPPVRRLAPELIALIAAGEVVERPASVVKELIENAIDAGARSVWVRLSNGGLDRIEVTDDGVGIPPGELALALERHATSKLDPAGPIHRIATLGFRGEALAAIASVAHLELVSRPPLTDRAHGLSVHGGEPGEALVEGHPFGTTVRVRDLFFNTPARRKFLHAPAAEQIEILTVVERMYLARPDVGVSVEAEGREVARFPSTTSLADAAARVLGVDFPAQSFPVNGALPSNGHLSAVLGRPALAGPNSSNLFVSINGRSIQNRALAQAIKVAFRDYIPRTRFPIGVVHLDMDLDRLDVNVHPTKREIRIVREREIAEAVRRAVRLALQGTSLVSQLAESPSESAPLPRPHGVPWPSSFDEQPAASVRSSLGRLGQTRLIDGEPPSVTSGAAIPSAWALQGVLFRLYWIAEDDRGLVLIDQHAASERVVYESLRRDGRLARQELLSPMTLHLTARQSQLLDQFGTAVEEAGYEIDRFGAEVYRVRSVPVHLGHRAAPESVLALLEELSTGGRLSVPNGVLERRAASIACHAAVRAGDPLERRQMERILAALDALPEANYACPHGRPIRVQISRSRLDRWFLRSGA